MTTILDLDAPSDFVPNTANPRDRIRDVADLANAAVGRLELVLEGTEGLGALDGLTEADAERVAAIIWTELARDVVFQFTYAGD